MTRNLKHSEVLRKLLGLIGRRNASAGEPPLCSSTSPQDTMPAELIFVPVAGDVSWTNPLLGESWMQLAATPYEASLDRYVVDSSTERTFLPDGRCLSGAGPAGAVSYRLEGRVLRLESNYYLMYVLSKDEILLQPLVGAAKFSLYLPVGQVQVLLRGNKRAGVERRTD